MISRPKRENRGPDHLWIESMSAREILLLKNRIKTPGLTETGYALGNGWKGKGKGKGKGEGNKGNQGADRMHRRDGTTKEHRHKQAGRLAACGWMDGDGQMGRWADGSIE